MQEYPVVKMKHLRNYTIGDVIRLKKTGDLVKIEEYSICAYCVFHKQCCEGFMSDQKTGRPYQKTGCIGGGEDFGGESVIFKPIFKPVKEY